MANTTLPSNASTPLPVALPTSGGPSAPITQLDLVDPNSGFFVGETQKPSGVDNALTSFGSATGILTTTFVGANGTAGNPTGVGSLPLLGALPGTLLSGAISGVLSTEGVSSYALGGTAGTAPLATLLGSLGGPGNPLSLLSPALAANPLG